jgi:ABC-type molybdenum transport system ATPase subunit/photorepair protein PhrA
MRFFKAIRFVESSASKQGDLKMKSTVIKMAAVAAVVALVGCTDLKPMQAQVDDLKAQIGKVSSDVAAHRADRTDANAAASAASSAAAAQSTANQALAAAQAAQTGVTDTNTKIDRMFQRTVSK